MATPSLMFSDRVHWYGEETVTASAISNDDTLLFLSDSDDVVKKGTVDGLLALVDSGTGLTAGNFGDFMEDLGTYSMSTRCA